VGECEEKTIESVPRSGEPQRGGEPKSSKRRKSDNHLGQKSIYSASTGEINQGKGYRQGKKKIKKRDLGDNGSLVETVKVYSNKAGAGSKKGGIGGT